jgi:hypothetical protein
LVLEGVDATKEGSMHRSGETAMQTCEQAQAKSHEAGE